MLTIAAALSSRGPKPSLAPVQPATQPATRCQTVLTVTLTKQRIGPSPARHKNCRPDPILGKLAIAHPGERLSSRTPASASRVEGSAVFSFTRGTFQFLIVTPAIRNARNPRPCNENSVSNRHKNTPYPIRFSSVEPPANSRLARPAGQALGRWYTGQTPKGNRARGGLRQRMAS
jgi:hypothetical protein